MMNLFYRGYMIHEDIHSVCYIIYDRRPARVELAIAGDSGEAMSWIDGRVAAAEAEALTKRERFPLVSALDHSQSPVATW